MKKVLLSAFLILAFGSYVFYQKFGSFIGSEEGNVVAPKNIATQTTGSSSDNAPTTATPPVSAPTSKTGSFKDGEYTGSVADAYYGNVQVKAIISGGKITDVQFLQYPNDRRTSININTQAIPYLKQEAIAAQNANVDIISGATQTSRAFIESLQSALSQAV